jgi:hypothetical protein
MSIPTETPAAAAAIRPFQVSIPEEDLIELRRRVQATRWSSKELVADASQGVQLATLQELARYWAADYDWRRCEAKLNALPQFTTEIDGVDIHFIHVKSPHPDALPLIITHGWPGSVIEMLETIGPLTDPTIHGGDAADAFVRLGQRPHRERLGRADAAPRLQPLRRPGRRPGRWRHRRAGPPRP